MKNYIISPKLQSQLDTYQNAPLKVGDVVEIDKSHIGFGGSSQNPNEIVKYDVIAVNGDDITVGTKYHKEYSTKVVNRSVIIKKDDFKIGINPLKNSMPRVNFSNVDIWQLLGRAGYDDDGSFRTDRNYVINGVKIAEMNWNPFVFDKNRNKQFYQRDFVWSLNDKQLLIESIYNEISIGTFIVRCREWSECERLVKQGETEVAFKDIVDGKQRLNALVEFVGNKFPDFDGNYFGDFSECGKRHFMNYSRFSYGELGGNTSDDNVIKVFLNTNFAGAPMSTDHINFVKSIQI